MNKDTRKIFLRTFGCQMNEYDTELIRTILSENGFHFVDNELDADIVLLNTCSVRENAHRKVFGRIHTIRHNRQGRPMLIGILGCMATNLKKDLLKDKSLNIDFIAGPDSYKRLPKIIHDRLQAHDKPFDIDLSDFETYSDIYPTRKSGVNAWIAVMRGCDNFCSYCVVPFTRGRERSRPVNNIVEEAQKAADQGYKQITLLGQNVNSYIHGRDRFSNLLNAVRKVEGIERIRFTSPHPKDFQMSLIDVMAKNPKICKHIHLPLQAGSNRILDSMNRTYTKEKFLDLTQKIRSRIPTISISTDIIVGFPTETSDEFLETHGLMKTIRFDAAFIFKYSPRPGTAAAENFNDDVPEEEKTRRVVALNKLQRQVSLERNQELIGGKKDILIELSQNTEERKICHGRTDSNKIVALQGQTFKVGQIVPAKITGASPDNLRGEPL